MLLFINFGKVVCFLGHFRGKFLLVVSRGFGECRRESFSFFYSIPYHSWDAPDSRFFFFFFPGVDGEDAMKSKVSRVQRGGIFLPHVGVFEVFIFCDYLTENNLALHLIIIRITQIIFLAAVGIRYFFALSRAAYFL